MNSDINALYISQSGLTMGNRDYYLDPEHEHIRKGSKEYLGKMCIRDRFHGSRF